MSLDIEYIGRRTSAYQIYSLCVEEAWYRKGNPVWEYQLSIES